MSTMVENVIAVEADNRPPMLEKSQYNSWQSRMKLYIRGKEHGKDLLDSVLNVSHPAKAETRGVTSWVSSQHNGVNNREN
ncbi:hypothetical protein Tco_1523610 [Tanacetum coccineum]